MKTLEQLISQHAIVKVIFESFDSSKDIDSITEYSAYLKGIVWGLFEGGFMLDSERAKIIEKIVDLQFEKISQI